jgi:hypothetical protein
LSLTGAISICFRFSEGKTMLGMQVAPAQLFFDFCLDDHVPADHLLRRIDCFLEL